MQILDFEFDLETVEECPVCESVKIIPHYKTSHKDVLCNYWYCTNCTARFLIERMTEESQKKYYDRTYSELTQHSGDEDQEIQTMRARNFSSILKSLGIKPKVHLDVGASVGILMEEFIKEFSCDSYGVEWGEDDRNIASAKGLHVTDTYPDIQFDIITMAHVLEHMNDPVRDLIKLGQLLNEDGCIMVEVPNAEANIHAYLLHHPIAYTAKSLEVLFERVGFDIEFGTLHSFPLKSPLSLHITLVIR